MLAWLYFFSNREKDMEVVNVDYEPGILLEGTATRSAQAPKLKTPPTLCICK